MPFWTCSFLGGWVREVVGYLAYEPQEIFEKSMDMIVMVPPEAGPVESLDNCIFALDDWAV